MGALTPLLGALRASVSACPAILGLMHPSTHPAPSTPRTVIGLATYQTSHLAAWVAEDGDDSDRRHRFLLDSLAIHAQGRWEMTTQDAEDRAANADAWESGARVFSAHQDAVTGTRVWCITEAVYEGQRASTCLLLPDDY